MPEAPDLGNEDAGSIRYGERLAEIGAVPSIGSIGDSFDNAVAETVNGYYKAELIYGPARSGPWKTVEDVELATLGWVYWHNNARLHGYLNDVPPAESKPRSTMHNGPTEPWSESNNPSLRQNQGDSLRVAGSCCVGAPEGCCGRRRARIVLLCSRPVGRISRDG